jgi:hypothetical protein
MKKLLLFVLLAAIALGIVAYFNPSVLGWLRQSTGTASKATTVYKWKDKKGVTHITSEPPPAGTPYEKQEYLNNTNVLPALPKDKH